MPDILSNYSSVPHLIVTFFLYSFFGWCMEMLVIRREKGYFENRGFAKSPFCIIYGFGAMIGYILLKPFSYNWFLLYAVGALSATAFEFITGKLMLKLFGGFWWNYNNKPFNYKGMLCLESTVGWGFIAVLLFAGMHSTVTGIAAIIPANVLTALSFLLVCLYICDFAISFKSAMDNAKASKEAELYRS